MSAHERIYRALLVAYPAEHRREYGEPMVQIMRDRLRDEGGGIRTAVVWAHVVADLAKTSFVERTETTMDTLRTGWWRIAAGLIAAVLAIGAVGSLVEPATGPWYKYILGPAALAVAPVLIVAGLIIRARNGTSGSVMIAIGVLPGAAAIVLFWYPPALVFGALSMAVALAALVDASNRSHARRTTDHAI